MRLSFTQSRRGSVLIVVIIFTAALAIAMPTYLMLSSSNMRMANRAFYSNAALGLAETGLEHGVWALNQVAKGEAPWAAWRIDRENARTVIGGFSYGGVTAGEVSVRIVDYESAEPKVFAAATVTLHDGSKINRHMYAELSASAAEAGSGLFAYGMLARDYINASGGASFDSWNSDPNGDGDFVPYSMLNRKDNVKIASASTSTPSIWLGSSDVYGSVAVGGATNSALHMSWGGQVGPRNLDLFSEEDRKDLWKKDPPGWLVSLKNHNALSTGFTASFEEISPLQNAVSQDPFVSPTWGEDFIGQHGAIKVISLDKIHVRGSHTLTIRGDVTLVLPPSDQDVIKIEGSGKIRLAEGAKLKIYTPGNIDISGAGFLNSASPRDLQIWGTATGDGQRITLAGSGNLSGAIYAPNASFTIPGGTNIYGAVVGKSFEMTGSGAFHYDESLITLGPGTTGSGPAGGERAYVVRVAELTAEEYQSWFAGS